MTSLDNHNCGPGNKTEEFPNAKTSQWTAVWDPAVRNQAKISGVTRVFKSRWFNKIATFVFLENNIPVPESKPETFLKKALKKCSIKQCCQNYLGKKNGGTWYWKSKYVKIDGREAIISCFEPQWFQQHEQDRWIFIQAAPNSFPTNNGFFSWKKNFFSLGPWWNKSSQ